MPRHRFSRYTSPEQRAIDAQILRAAEHAEPAMAAFLERLVGEPTVHRDVRRQNVRMRQLELFAKE